MAWCSSAGMPTPVSATVNPDELPILGRVHRDTLPPSGVNFTALLSRLYRICLKRVRSAQTSRSRRHGGARPAMRLISASGRIMASTSRQRIARAVNASCSISMRPASILERSRISLITCIRCRAPPLHVRPRAFLLIASGPLLPSASRSEKPMMALRGVRSSWLMRARNALLRRLACSRRCRATTKSVTSVSSTMRSGGLSVSVRSGSSATRSQAAPAARGSSNSGSK